uniref:RING-type domain-containing protein n=1 Tax=Scleropages formosus TaxID=113540 RepID=A0A8C9V069_SCLFO
MAQVGELVNHDRLCCFICQDIFKDPVTIPCGHNYCKSCIKGYWNQEDNGDEYSCPKCRMTFFPKPILCQNTMVAELVEKLKKTGLQTTPPEHCYYRHVRPDTHLDLEAVRSTCLVFSLYQL